MAQTKINMSSEKAGYHHGDLRSCLVSAALSLVEDEGAEACTLKAASQMAGVSVAAPYRHFCDKAALLSEVASVGFARLNEACVNARDQFPAGSVDGLTAMGQAFVNFAGSHPHLFRLMFDMRGRPVEPSVSAIEARDPDCSLTEDVGHTAFDEYLTTVAAVITSLGGPSEDLMKVAMPLWSLVHGAACLLIDDGFAVKAPGTLTDEVIEIASRNFFLGYQVSLKEKAASPLNQGAATRGNAFIID